MLEDIAEKNIEELVDKHKAERNERWKRWYRSMPEEGFDKTETCKRAVFHISTTASDTLRSLGLDSCNSTN